MPSWYLVYGDDAILVVMMLHLYVTMLHLYVIMLLCDEACDDASICL
jgi:hypothetical protein